MKGIGKKDIPNKSKQNHHNDKNNSLVHDNSVQKVEQYQNESFQNSYNNENDEGDQIIFANKVQNEVENCDMFTNSEESE